MLFHNSTVFVMCATPYLLTILSLATGDEVSLDEIYPVYSSSQYVLCTLPPSLQITTHTSTTPSRAEELSEMAKLLRERCASLEKHVADKIMVVSASLDFHNNMKNVSLRVLRTPLLAKFIEVCLAIEQKLNDRVTTTGQSHCDGRTIFRLICPLIHGTTQKAEVFLIRYTKAH